VRTAALVYDALARHGARAPFRIPFDTALAIAADSTSARAYLGLGQAVLWTGILVATYPRPW